MPVKILLKMRPTRAQDLEPRTDDTMISMEFDLGSKGLGRFTKSKSKSADESSGSKESAMAICRSGAVMWEPNDPPVELSCHVQLDQATNTVQPRSLKLRLKSCSWAYAKTSTLGTLKIDMAAYATHEFSDLCVFRFKNKDPSRAAEAAVELEIWCRWEKLNHKQIVAVNSADSSDGKPDFDLATCDDDLSEATAAGGGASDSDEELDDLESDAHTTTTTSSEDATHTEPSSGTSPARTDGHQDSRTNDREATDATATATATATSAATTPTTPSRSSLAYSRGSILESTPTRTTTPPATASFEVTSKLQRLESENTWLQSQLDQLQEQLQKQEHELERLREHAREAELLKAQIASLMQEVANANANAKASSSSSSSSSSKRKSKQIDSVLEGVTKQRLMAAEKRVHELERQVEDLEKEKRSSERANASAAAATSDVAALQREVRRTAAVRATHTNALTWPRRSPSSKHSSDATQRHNLPTLVLAHRVKTKRRSLARSCASSKPSTSRRSSTPRRRKAACCLHRWQPHCRSSCSAESSRCARSIECSTPSRRASRSLAPTATRCVTGSAPVSSCCRRCRRPTLASRATSSSTASFTRHRLRLLAAVPRAASTF